MQASKVKINTIYAIKRGGKLERFHVTEIVTRKTIAYPTSRNSIKGYTLEDGINRRNEWEVDPQDLLGPYEEQAELVERKAKEDAERKAQADAREAKARTDRLALYAFVGVTPPKNPKDYNQLFRAQYGSVEFGSEGKQAIIDRVHAMRKSVAP